MEMLRSENNVVMAVGDDIVAKAVETNNGAALQKEAAILTHLEDFEEVVHESIFGVGPFETQNWTVLLLERLYVQNMSPSLREIHQSLKRLHDFMSDLQLNLTVWTDQLLRTHEVWQSHPFATDQQHIAQEIYERFVSEALRYDGPTQMLHGDAWSGQVLKTQDGLRWIDFEAASIGPKEWDLAASDVVDGYGPYDEELWKLLKVVRSWTVAVVWSNVNARHSPQLIEHVNVHMNRLSNVLRAL
jgi:thiamine kinase-like enzyme